MATRSALNRASPTKLPPCTAIGSLQNKNKAVPMIGIAIDAMPKMGDLLSTPSFEGAVSVAWLTGGVRGVFGVSPRSLAIP
jgi:hypothetical protein